MDRNQRPEAAHDHKHRAGRFQKIPRRGDLFCSELFIPVCFHGFCEEFSKILHENHISFFWTSFAVHHRTSPCIDFFIYCEGRICIHESHKINHPLFNTQFPFGCYLKKISMVGVDLIRLYRSSYRRCITTSSEHILIENNLMSECLIMCITKYIHHLIDISGSEWFCHFFNCFWFFDEF